MKRAIGFWAALVVLGASAGPASAALVTYSNQATFLSVTGATSATGPLPNLGNVGQTPTTVGSVTFNFVPIASGVFGTAGSGGVTNNDWTLLLAGNDLALSGPEDFDVVFAGPVTAAGFDLVEPISGPNVNAPPIDSTFTVTLKLGAILVGSFSFNPANDVAAFAGVSSDQVFDRLEIRETTGDSENEFFGQFYTTAAVPAPASAALLSLAIGAVIVLRARIGRP